MMYPKLYRSFLFPFYESFLRNRNTLKYLKELESNQWLSKSELQNLQMQKLRALLYHAHENVPYYMNLFNKLKIDPRGIKTLEDFQQLPLLSKSDIQNNKDNLLAVNYRNIKKCHDSTGGSTGILVEITYSRDNYERRMATAIRGDRWTGWDLGEKHTLIWGRYLGKISRLQKIKKVLHYASMRQQYICSYNFSIDSFPKYISLINKFKPKLIVSYVTPLYNMAKYIKERNIKCHSPKAIITSAEKLFEHQRQLIESVFETVVFDRYGCTEVGFIAAECDRHNGMHVNADNLIVEIIKNNKPVNPGETGEIVITDLNNYVMPFIRYRLGDIGTQSLENCDCGRGLPIIKNIEGRVVDTIVTPDGRYVSGQFFQYMLDIVKGVEQFQIVQKEINELTIKLVVNSDFQKRYQDILLKEIQSVMGNQIVINFDFVDKIPLQNSGKYRYTISEVPVDFGNI